MIQKLGLSFALNKFPAKKKEKGSNLADRTPSSVSGRIITLLPSKRWNGGCIMMFESKRFFLPVVFLVFLLLGCEMQGLPDMMGSLMAKHVRAVRGDSYGVNDFSDNGNGTITDSATGLMWAQSDNGSGLDWENALAYAESSTLGGHSDWRLPNVKELQGIVDYSYAPGATDSSKDKAAIDTLFSCTAITNEAGTSDFGYYWTGTSAKFTSGDPYYYAWYIAFGRAVNGEGLDYHGAGAARFDTKYEGGNLGEGGERYYNYVRLVRDVSVTSISYKQIATGQIVLYGKDGEVISSLSSGDSFYGQDASYLKGSIMSYVNNGNGTITDSNTGLMWQQDPPSDTMYWSESGTYCENLELGGYDDWRMPTVKELFSISDFSSGWPYLNTDYFSLSSDTIDKSEQYWSSNKYVGTTVEGGTNAAFGVNHVTGHIKAYPASSN